MSGGKGEVLDLVGAILTLSIITNILNLLGVNPFLINVIYGMVLLFAIVFANFQQIVRQKMLIKIATYRENK
jgi:ribose/xylose/arabinose/galactoside ABC-type transport system permease subunit